MREYYHNEAASGFSYAYTYPGLNKVLQAAGRLIRSESDRGALLLVDSRFSSPEYLNLLPQEWHPIPKKSQGLLMEDFIRNFWDKTTDG
jgi:Rad3-related DNA helicase